MKVKNLNCRMRVIDRYLNESIVTASKEIEGRDAAYLVFKNENGRVRLVSELTHTWRKVNVN